MAFTPPLMGVREYARTRNIHPTKVSAACRDGRLKEAVVRDPATGRVSGLHPLVADREWLANTDYSRAPQHAPKVAGLPQVAPPVDTAPEGLADSAAELKHWQAQLAELKYREAAGELLLAADVERQIVATFAACKAKLLAIPSRARQALPHLTVADIAAIDGLVREALEDLAGSAGGDT